MRARDWGGAQRCVRGGAWGGDVAMGTRARGGLVLEDSY